MKSAVTHWANLEAALDDSSMNLNETQKQTFIKRFERVPHTCLSQRLNKLVDIWLKLVVHFLRIMTHNLLRG